MLVAGAQWLPQYAEEIPKAKKRLEENPPHYNPVTGIVQKEKTVKEMERQASKFRQLAAAAAKEDVK